jgi:hypothetical protein
VSSELQLQRAAAAAWPSETGSSFQNTRTFVVLFSCRWRAVCGCCSWCHWWRPIRFCTEHLHYQHMGRGRNGNATNSCIKQEQCGIMLFSQISCFSALQVESSVRLLQLVSVVAEAAGERLQPHLGALAAALPQVNMCCCCDYSL